MYSAGLNAAAKALLSYYDQKEEALDYAVLGALAPQEASGKCVYCNHCQPCPMGLDIGLVNKYYDLAHAGDGHGGGALQDAGKDGGSLRSLRALRQPLSLPCEAE